MSASETVRRHTFGAPEDMGPPALERAAHQLMIDEANRRISSEKRILELEKQLAAKISEAEASEAGRIAAETKTGELGAELLKHRAGYQAAIADADTKLLQARESLATANTLAAQARAEADVLRKQFEEIKPTMEGMQRQIEALMEMGTEEPLAPTVGPPPSYRVNVVGRDAAGDLRTLEIIPVERT